MTVFWICLAVLVTLCGLFLFLVFPTARRHPHRTLLKGAFIAHRGLHGEKAGPENSLSAFQAAVDAGFIIETDIHLTADGEVVIFHDDTLDRLCGVSGRPENMTLAQLKALRLAGTAQTIPTLAECLALVDGQVPLLIEFKTKSRQYKALCEAADRILSAYQGIYFIQSFYPFVPFWYRKNRPAVCRGQLAAAFREESPAHRLLGCLVFNVLARPDFVAYDYRDEKHLCRRLCTKLGAHPVGWTFPSKEALETHRNHFDTYIFEGFLPDVK